MKCAEALNNKKRNPLDRSVAYNAVPHACFSIALSVCSSATNAHCSLMRRWRHRVTSANGYPLTECAAACIVCAGCIFPTPTRMRRMLHLSDAACWPSACRPCRRPCLVEGGGGRSNCSRPTPIGIGLRLPTRMRPLLASWAPTPSCMWLLRSQGRCHAEERVDLQQWIILMTLKDQAWQRMVSDGDFLTLVSRVHRLVNCVCDTTVVFEKHFKVLLCFHF